MTWSSAGLIEDLAHSTGRASPTSRATPTKPRARQGWRRSNVDGRADRGVRARLQWSKRTCCRGQNLSYSGRGASQGTAQTKEPDMSETLDRTVRLDPGEVATLISNLQVFGLRVVGAIAARTGGAGPGHAGMLCIHG